LTLANARKASAIATRQRRGEHHDPLPPSILADQVSQGTCSRLFVNYLVSVPEPQQNINN
jgi:hypothetical protein